MTTAEVDEGSENFLKPFALDADSISTIDSLSTVRSLACWSRITLSLTEADLVLDSSPKSCATVPKQLGFDHESLTYHFGGRDYRSNDVEGHVVGDLIS